MFLRRAKWIAVAILLAISPASWGQCDDECDLDRLTNAFCDLANEGHWACLQPRPPEGSLFLVLDSFCSSGFAEAGGTKCKTRDEICTRLKKIKEQWEPPVLAYDHPTGRWSALYGLDASGKRSRVDKNISGIPTVHLKKSEDLTVIVERTNPLLFSLELVESTEEDIPELQQLQQLADLVSSHISSLLKFGNTTVHPLGKIPLAAGEPIHKIVDPDDEIKNESYDEVKLYSKKVSCYVSDTSQQDYFISAFLQAMELNEDASYRTVNACPGLSAADFTLEGLRTTLQNLNTSYIKIAQDPFGCSNTLEAFDTAIDGAAEQFVAAVGTFRGLKTTETCSVVALEQADKLDGKLADILKDDNRSLEERLEEAKNDPLLRQFVQGLISYSKAEAALLESVKTLLASRAEIHKALAEVKLFEQQLRLHSMPPSVAGEVQTDEVERRLYLIKDGTPRRWDKIETHEIKVSGNGTRLANLVSTLPNPAETRYKLDSGFRSLFGIGTALTYTSLNDPTFSAVTDPDDSTKQVIAVTREDSRAGQFALMFDYQIVRHLCRDCSSTWKNLGLEFGAGPDTSLFVGLNSRFGRWVRTGAGLTIQEVDELASGQRVGDVVAADSDIRTTEGTDTAFYFSLSFRLESIQFGGKSE